MIQFTRGEVADILGIVPRTIQRREERGTYPQPRRDTSNRRVYVLKEVMQLQDITYGKIFRKALFEALYDKGIRNHRKAAKLISEALEKYLQEKTIHTNKDK